MSDIETYPGCGSELEPVKDIFEDGKEFAILVCTECKDEWAVNNETGEFQ